MGQPKRKERDVEAGGVSDGASGGEGATWARPPALSRPALGVLVGAVVLLNLPMIHYFVFRGRPEATATVPYANDFTDPASIERDFFSTGGHWRLVNGELLAPGVKNNPLWLKAKLPQNVAVEFDVRSMSQEGDIKAEIFGDGSNHATGYVLIHGGWNNTLSIIARLDEHGAPMGSLDAEAARVAREKGIEADLVKTGVYRADTRARKELSPSVPVQIGRRYHWRIERRDATITWFIDGQEYGRFTDPLPLVGEDHNRFGFSSWEAQLFFDNLKVQPL